jgi:hypothetical protein
MTVSLVEKGLDMDVVVVVVEVDLVEEEEEGEVFLMLFKCLLMIPSVLTILSREHLEAPITTIPLSIPISQSDMVSSE